MTTQPLDPQDLEQTESISAEVIVDEQGLLRCSNCETVLNTILQEFDDVYFGMCPYCGKFLDAGSLRRAAREIRGDRAQHQVDTWCKREDDFTRHGSAGAASWFSDLMALLFWIFLGMFGGYQNYSGGSIHWFGSKRSSKENSS